MPLQTPRGEPVEVCLVRLRIDGLYARCSRPAPPGRDRQVGRDLLVQGEHPAHVAFVYMPPEGPIGVRPNQFHRDPDGVAGPLQRALHDAFDIVQLGSNLRQGLGGLFVLPRRRSRDHVDAVDLGEMRGDCIGHAVGEVVLRMVPRKVLEREHDEGPDRFCGRRRVAG